MRPPSELAARFRAGGRRLTPQRWVVFEALSRNPDAHPSADEVYQQVRRRMPTVSCRTIYETLNILADLGEIHPLDLGTGTTRFDPNPAPHAHAVCRCCGRIEHVPLDLHELVDRLPPTSHPLGWIDVVIHWVCAQCAVAVTPPRYGRRHAPRAGRDDLPGAVPRVRTTR